MVCLTVVEQKDSVLHWIRSVRGVAFPSGGAYVVRAWAAAEEEGDRSVRNGRRPGIGRHRRTTDLGPRRPTTSPFRWTAEGTTHRGVTSKEEEELLNIK